MLFLVGFILFTSGRTILRFYPKYEKRFSEIYTWLAPILQLPCDANLSFFQNLRGQLGIRAGVHPRGCQTPAHDRYCSSEDRRAACAGPHVRPFRGGLNMKKLVAAMIAGILAVSFLSLSAGAQSVRGAWPADRDALIQSETETAVSMLSVLADRVAKGVLSLEQAMTLGADLLRGMSYGSDGYFWADTTEGVNVVLYGRADVEGRNRLGDRDPEGMYYVKAFLDAGKAGGGFVEYMFARKGESVAVPKRSYVLPFRPFGWVVGTGYYR